ncbi:hypothetical protein [Polymorphospora rubra]|uniref:Lipoprotein n=1 Tax=Polymorphospora rubra TaxID=338584 RepID=A0A810MWK0_9ACTN|nr:hypothetical protein [Polymorphospora rubra]BCJ64930.1 hypothetical protein Prubr_19510 [Polymorphospora rubra]
MTTRRTTGFAVALGMVAVLALTGCADTEPADSGRPDTASRFAACLETAGEEARVNAAGQVLVKTLADRAGGPVDFDGAIVAVEADEAGNPWIAATDPSAFAGDPSLRATYERCLTEHPDFTQPQTPRKATDGGTDRQEPALAFADCGRRQGHAWVTDPDPANGDAIVLPDTVTEAEFRSLLQACHNPTHGVAFIASDAIGFDWAAVIDEVTGSVGR